MGVIRSTPENHINIASEQQKLFKSVSASTCGWQQLMQDYLVSFECHNTHFLVLLDGMGGPQIAQFCRDNLPTLISKNQLIQIGQIQSGLQSVIGTVDQVIKNNAQQVNQIQKKHHIPIQKQLVSRAGCSIILCAINEQNIIIANVGNCKGYICYRKDPTKAVLIGGNHSATNQQDYKRVCDAGGYFLHEKVNGMLPFTRSIGHLQYKQNKLLKKHQQILISFPSIFNLRREDIESIVLGSSGLWERPAYVLNQLMKNQSGGRKKTAREKVGTLLQQLIAADCRATNGLQNMALTFIEIK